MSFFGSSSTKHEIDHKDSARRDFEFVSNDAVYLDSACQTLRPVPVQDAVMKYFREYNSCGGRVKYQWGQRVDEEVQNVRDRILRLLGKSSKEYQVSFTLNTTYGLNLILQQLSSKQYSQIITSDIEHNSVLLSTLTAAERLDIPRKILNRNNDGSLQYESKDTQGAVAVLNTVSNIDGRILLNAKVIVDELHDGGGILIIDGAQSVGHDFSLLQNVDFDALCFSGHKTYGPSLGVIVAKKQLVDSLELSFVGGGMVEKLDEHSFTLPKGDTVCKLEPGLQDFAGIIGLGAALKWIETYKPEGQHQKKQQQTLSTVVFYGLSAMPEVHLLNVKPSTTISFYSKNIDAHRLAVFLSQQNLMVRSGYFCCHYYLQNVKNSPPLVRVSIGLHNTEKDVEKFIQTLSIIIKNNR